MKTKLLKMALCAVSLLPMGAWAEVVNKTWDFTSWSSATIANLEAGVYNETTNPDGEWNFSSNIYSLRKSPSNPNTLTANGVTISEFSGLTFNYPNSSERIKIYNAAGSSSRTGLYFSSSRNNEAVNIPVIGGKKISITMESQNSSNPTRMECANNKVLAINQKTVVKHPMGTIVTDEFIVSSSVTSETVVSFGGQYGIGRPLMIYSITISDATQDELNYANSKTLFSTDDVITATTLWTFDQYKVADYVDETGSGINYSGLYLKGHTSKTSNTSNANKVETGLASSIFGSYSVSTANSIWFAGGHTVNVGETKNRRAGQFLTDALGINIGVEGTLYVTASGDGKTLTVNRGNSDDTQTLANDADISSFKIYASSVAMTKNTPSTHSVAITKAGTYWISASGGFKVYAVCFIPASDKAIPMTKTITLTGDGGGYATFSAAQNYEVPEGVTAYYVSNVDGTENKAQMTAINADGVIPACQGVILYKEGVSSDTEITLISSDSYSTLTNSMMPNLADYVLPADNGTYYNYTLAAGPTFKHSSGSGTLAAGKAFLRTTVNVEGGSSRGLDLVFDDGDVTGISEVNAVASDNKFYNLQGVEVKVPAKGLYIVNGKKVVIK